MVSDRVALMVEGEVNLLIDGGVVDQHAAMAAGRLWLLPSVWIKAGVGIAGAPSHIVSLPRTLAGYALLGAMGFEVASSRTYEIDIQVRFSDGLYSGGLEQFGSLTLDSGISRY